MIAVRLTSGLGNNLFQYAAARTIAESKGFAFCHFPLRSAKYYWRWARKELPLRLRGRTNPGAKQLAQADISRYFTLGGADVVGNALRRLRWRLRPAAATSRFLPVRKVILADQSAYEIFDERAFDVSDWTELAGAFQSDAYFSANRSNVLSWFELNGRYADELARLERTFPAPPERRCCIHVRRGDQLVQDKGLAWKDHGWSLPIDYYKAAIKQLPPDLFYIIATDSPDYVREAFSFLPAMHVCDGNSEAVDIHLFARCKYNIIANSTFSWWGAWLNQHDDKVVIAPKYHMGWSKRVWIPWSFDRHPENWSYIDVLDVVD